ncbi:hypothetical protein [Photobacterium kishitanii]|uniref:Uncharacterized protein n=1 Tax=Photobacterium kishitanii TaxID=318456 RepID=A0A2T3KL69_9GAMM|nr:hypothetical protein [Photobacterium kishitanii]PSV00465.1 hypothetical protein C9J27_04855 [Photobacterium kishitanii]
MKKPSNSKQVAKRFGVAETLTLIFSYPRPFQKLVENADATDELSRKLGFSETNYNLIIKDFLETEGLKSEDVNRLKVAFSVSNLHQANLIIEWDHGKKRIILSDALLELIRLSDSRLIKELTSVEYKGLLDELKRLRLELKSSPSTTSDNYFDLRYAIFSHIRRIRNAVKNNEIKFRQISEKLAEISLGVTDNDSIFAAAKRDMYFQASKIYERHILPTVNFLNENLRLEGGNLFDVLNDIINIFVMLKEHSSADELVLSALNLSNAYKPLEKISGDVRQFLSINRDNARAFNAFEHINSILAENLSATTGMSLRNKELCGDKKLQELFNFYRHVGGSKGLQMQNAMRFNESSAFINSMKTEVDQFLELKKLIITHELEDTVCNHNNVSSATANDLKRAESLTSLIKDMPLRPTDDLYNMIHERLCNALQDYSFFDLNVAMEMINKRDLVDTKLHLKPTGFIDLIEIDDRLFQYRVRKLLKVTVDETNADSCHADHKQEIIYE